MTSGKLLADATLDDFLFVGFCLFVVVALCQALSSLGHIRSQLGDILRRLPPEVKK